jgi:tetratricopeptide (TPR) repeat protein
MQSRNGRAAIVWTRLVTVVLIALSPWPAEGQQPAAAGPAPLGRVSFDPGCEPSVRADFERGLALLHHMTYPAAYRAFEDVSEGDPSCALAYWGMAMTLFQPLWPNRPSQEDLEQGWALAQRARDLSDGAGVRSALVRTGEAFFDPAGAPDYWARIRAWSDATGALHAAYPDNVEARALHALAILATAPLDGDAAASHARAADLLTGILQVVPTHPGAVHYTIHANDFRGRAELSLDVVRRYGDIAPANPHALHMPTHIFVRLGLWDEVVDWNLRAADAALAQPAGPRGEWVWDEYPHATEYLVYAYLQRGEDELARARVERMSETPDLQPGFKTAFHLTSTAARYALERRAWDEAVELRVRPYDTLDWDRLPWPEAVTWYARGLGAAHLGDRTAASESARRLEALRDAAEASGEMIFVAPIEIMRLELAAWASLEDGDADQAVARMQEAVALEARTPKHPVTPGATLPAGELLGDLYLRLDRPSDAFEAYRASDEQVPGRLNTLAGLARASSASGNREAAATWYRRLLTLASNTSGRAVVAEAERYLSGEAQGRPPLPSGGLLRISAETDAPYMLDVELVPPHAHEHVSRDLRRREWRVHASELRPVGPVRVERAGSPSHGPHAPHVFDHQAPARRKHGGHVGMATVCVMGIGSTDRKRHTLLAVAIFVGEAGTGFETLPRLGL